MRVSRLTGLLLLSFLFSLSTLGLHMSSNDLPRISFFNLFGFTGLRLDVHWEPTPPDVVAEMLTIADVTSSDVVYDLGCGDGRIVIAAARDKGARAVGIDLDPERIRASNENAARAGMGDSVRFIHDDLFKTDYSDATVLMLFLFPDINLRLRPAILTDLRPGTRVVSYCHNMEAWEPDAQKKIRKNTVYLWVVPANVGGIWHGRLYIDGTAKPVRLDLQQEFQKVTGKIILNGRSFPLVEGRMKGTALTCVIRDDTDGRRTVMTISGSADGHTMNGTLRRGASSEGPTFNLTRNPLTAAPIAR